MEAYLFVHFKEKETPDGERPLKNYIKKIVIKLKMAIFLYKRLKDKKEF